MKTTLDLNDDLLIDTKRRAAGLTQPPGRFRLELPVVEGSRPPAVDVADRRALYDFLEEGA